TRAQGVQFLFEALHGRVEMRQGRLHLDAQALLLLDEGKIDALAFRSRHPRTGVEAEPGEDLLLPGHEGLGQLWAEAPDPQHTLGDDVEGGLYPEGRQDLLTARPDLRDVVFGLELVAEVLFPRQPLAVTLQARL